MKNNPKIGEKRETNKKMWTCLIKCYLGHYRFLEDLDFSISSELTETQKKILDLILSNSRISKRELSKNRVIR